MEIGDEGESRFEVAFDGVELQLEGSESFFDVVQFATEALLFALEEVERDGACVVGFEQLGSLVEGSALPGDQLLSLDPGVLAELGDLFEDHLLRLEPQVGAQLDRLVKVADRIFHLLDEHRSLSAAGAASLSADADKVGIDASGSVLGVADDQTAAALLAVLVRLAAEDRTLEVVVVDAFFLPREVVSFEQPLDLVEGLTVDQRLVLAGVFDAAVANDADVVRIFQHLVEGRDRDRSRGALRRWPTE